MTSRQLYEAVLIEVNKDDAPSLMLEDFNYFANKAYTQYVNKQYNLYDVNQQMTDNLRVLKGSAKIPVTESNRVTEYDDLSLATNATYEVILPNDYLHILNCICIYEVRKTYSCYNQGNTWRCPATRLTADVYSQVLDNSWNRPTYKRPYYYIHNLNTSNTVPTYPYNNGKGTDAPTTVSLGTDGNGSTIVEGTGIPKTINIGGNNVSNVERGAQLRYGNVSQVRMEIRYGTDNSVFRLKGVLIDYIKVPQYIRLTQEQLDKTEDTSQVLEFPDYVCQEIINELVHLIMEHIGDPKLQTHPVVTQSIANPAQQQTEPVAQPQQ